MDHVSSGTREARHLGVVQAEASGSGSCDAIAERALHDLLAEARALGGSGVEEIKFRARWHWTGEVLCRRSLFPPLVHTSARVKGFAVR